MNAVSIPRVLETCLNQRALEVWLLAGKQPLLRFPEGVRELIVGDTLTADEIAPLVFKALAPNLMNAFHEQGFCAFDYQCAWRDNERVRVFVLRHGKSTMATLTPLPASAPGLVTPDAS